MKGLQKSHRQSSACLLTHPAVADAGVVGEPDARTPGDERPHAFVVLKPETQLSAVDGPPRGRWPRPTPPSMFVLRFVKRSRRRSQKILREQCCRVPPAHGGSHTRSKFKNLGLRGGWGIHADDVVCTEDRLELDPSSAISADRDATSFEENRPSTREFQESASPRRRRTPLTISAPGASHRLSWPQLMHHVLIETPPARCGRTMNSFIVDRSLASSSARP